MPDQWRSGRRRKKARAALAGKGFAAFVIGVLLLTVIPNMMRSQLGPTVAQVLRPAGLVTLMLGAVLLMRGAPAAAARGRGVVAQHRVLEASQHRVWSLQS